MFIFSLARKLLFCVIFKKDFFGEEIHNFCTLTLKILVNLHFDFLVDCHHALHIPEQKDLVLEHERVDTELNDHCHEVV